MTSSFNKDVLRSIRSTLGRFLAIMGIVALGSGFFAGLHMSGQDMRLGIDEYADDAHLFDIQLVSTLGLVDADVDLVRGVEGVRDVMPSSSADVVIATAQGAEYNAKVSSIDLDLLAAASQEEDESVAEDAGKGEQGLAPISFLNRFDLVEGRYPQAEDECIIGESTALHDIAVGDTITFVNGVDPLEDTFTQTEFKVVGVVRSCSYVAVTLGATNLGDGAIDRFLYIPKQDFARDVYTELYVRAEGAQDLLSPSAAYDDVVSKLALALQDASSQRARIRLDEVTEDARKQIEEAQEQVDQGRAQAQGGQETILSNQRTLEETLAQLDSAQEQINQGWDQYNNGYAQLLENQGQVDAGREELTYNISLRDQAVAGAQELNQALRSKGLTVWLVLFPEDWVWDLLSQDLLTAKQAAQTLLDAGMELDSAGFLDTAGFIAQTDVQFADAQLQLDDAQAQLDEGWSQLAQSKALLEQQQATLDDAYAQVRSGELQIQGALDQLEGSFAQLEEAQEKVDASWKELEQVELPVWYLLTRHENVGYESFSQDTQRIDSIARVFPLIFLLVAALVALTTMTRMVEDERVIIGTYKALGYNRSRIASKYLIYAGSAGLIGSIIGVLVLCKLIPFVIFRAYSTMYSIPPCPLPLAPGPIILGAGLTIGTTLLATYSAVRAALRETPASLLLPRAPQPGKRILLEHIKPLWSRMSFMWKITARNLFRYKKRLWMTVIGIAGCTALLLTGFGIKDSINDMLDAQFRDIYRYDVSIGVDSQEIEEGSDGLWDSREYAPDGSDATLDLGAYLGDDLAKLLEDKSPALLLNLNVRVSSAGGRQDIVTHLMVPQDVTAINNAMALQNRQARGTELQLGAQEAIVSEKLCKLLDVKVGDQVEIALMDASGQASDTRARVTIAAVTENYLLHYVYISPELYQSILDQEAPYYNQVLIQTGSDKDARVALEEQVSTYPHITTVADNDEVMKNYDEMLESLNSVTFILIISAAALAFIVLYNLANINITERQREIASLKVLGFTDREVNIYIYREIALLTLLGCLLGLVAGYFFCQWIVATVEVEVTMFYRDMRPVSFLISLVLTMFFSLVVAFFMNLKLKAIDMVESLKSVE